MALTPLPRILNYGQNQFRYSGPTLIAQLSPNVPRTAWHWRFHPPVAPGGSIRQWHPA
jgi:hypothetical protein